MFRVLEDPDVWVSVNNRGWAQQQYEERSPPPKEDQNEIVEVFTTQVAELRKGINALRRQQRGGAAGAGAQNKRKRQCDQSGSEKRTIANALMYAVLFWTRSAARLATSHRTVLRAGKILAVKTSSSLRPMRSGRGAMADDGAAARAARGAVVCAISS